MKNYANAWNSFAVVAALILAMVRNISGPSALFLLLPFVTALVATLVIDRRPFYIVARLINGAFALIALTKLLDDSLTMGPFVWLVTFVLTVIPPILNVLFLSPRDDLARG